MDEAPEEEWALTKEEEIEHDRISRESLSRMDGEPIWQVLDRLEVLESKIAELKEMMEEVRDGHT